MKQYEAVIQTLERLGGQATLAELYREVMKIGDAEWGTKTPFASIRRIVQTRPEIFRVRPGLWALESHKEKLGIAVQDEIQPSPKTLEQNHSYFQGLLVIIGNLRGFATFVPQQDKNRMFVNRPLRELRTLQELPQYSHEFLVKRSGSVDVIWFNNRQMPDSFFEVEHSTEIQNSLLKFHDLRDFFARMVIVADEHRHREFRQKIQSDALIELKNRVDFLSYEVLVKQYEYEALKASEEFVI